MRLPDGKRQGRDVQTATATLRGSRLSRTAIQALPPSGLPTGAVGLTTRFTRLGLIDREGPAPNLLALELGNGGSGGGAIGHLDKAKAFGAAGLAIRNDPDLVHHAIRLEELAQVMISGAKREIANINIHGKFPIGKGTHDRQVIRTVCRSTRLKSHTQEKRRGEPRNHKKYLMIS